MKRILQFLMITWPLVFGVAHAQTPTVALTANPANAVGSTPVTLAWTTTPAASSCTASGDWTGTKAASGTTTLAAITASKNYTLTCAFANVVTVQLGWVPPTTNTDNTPLTNLTGYKIYYGTSSTALSQTATVAAPASGAPVLNISNGSWFFAATAISSTGTESVKSSTAQKTVPALSASASAAVTVTPNTTPNPPTNLQVVDPVAFDVRPNESTFAFDRGRSVGAAKLGAACDEDRTTGGGFYALERPSRVRLTRQPRSEALVARCAPTS